jgi:hypothetical protein
MRAMVVLALPVLLLADAASRSAELAAAEPEATAHSLMVVVNRQRPETDIPLRTLVRVFRGEQRFWDDGDRMYPILPPEDGPEVRGKFLDSAVKLDARAFALHWKNLVFRGDVTDQPISPPDERRAVQSVFSERGALAVIEGSVVKNLDKVAKVLTVNGRDRDAADYPLKW